MKPNVWPALALAAALFFGISAPTLAVPSFARQTGMPCSHCHIGSFGPQLTPDGMRFKLRGYTQTDGQGVKVPLAAMLIGSWTHTAKDQDPAPQHFNSNNNAAVQEAAIFLAGRLTDHVGAFIESTYSGIDRKSALDNLDVRYARSMDLAGADSVVGLSINNNPTVQDPFNTLQAWRFPFASSDLAPGFASPVVENLGQSVIGVSGYAFWKNSLYAEIGAYNSLSKTGLNMINADDPGRFKGMGPYWRLAYFQDRELDNFSVGLFGFNVDIQPDRGILGTVDKYRDLGIDAFYQYLGSRQHIFTVNGSYLHERQNLDFTLGSDQPKTSLDQYRIASSYHYNQTWGLGAGLFETRGSSNESLNPNSLNGRPNTSGYIVQADWTPWGKASSWGAPFANVRLGVQYTGYHRFNGDTHYLDDNGNDRRARDNNTLFLFLWTAI